LPVYILKTASYEENHRLRKQTLLALRLKDAIHRLAVDLKAKAGARAPKVYRKNPINEIWAVNDPLSQKFRNSAPKEFIRTPVHVLCSNFTEIGHQVKRCVVNYCFVDKKVRKYVSVGSGALPLFPKQ